MHPIRTKCRYHVQDKPNFCGPAVAMMILAQQGQNLDTLDQGQLNGILVAPVGSSIATLPGPLLNFLNSRIQSAFSLASVNSSPSVARHVIQSLVHNVPSAVTIFEDGHWAVVEGVSTDVDPALGNPYRVFRIWMHNPSPGAVAEVPPHKADDGCGFLGLPGIKEDGYDYNEWLNLVNLPENAALKFKCVVSSQPLQIEQPESVLPLPPAEPLFNKERAEFTLRENLDSEILSRLSPSGEVKTNSLGLVHSLSEGISDYYLVSIADDRGVIGLARIDAKRPWLRSIGILGRPREKVAPDQQDILQTLLDTNLPEIPSNSEEWWNSQLKSAQLVWRPCIESMSLYIPFLAVPRGSNLQPQLPQSHVFVRFTTEKSVFLELTDPLQGG